MAPVAVLEATLRDQQLLGLRNLAQRAAAAFGYPGARLSLLEHKQNTTFRVRPLRDPDDGFLLRVAMAGRYSPAVIESEMVWLQSLSELDAPQPQPTSEGSLVAQLFLDGEPEPRCCTLFRWLPGRPLERSLEPSQAAAIGELLARLHRQAEDFTPPPRFERPRWDLDRLIGKAQVLPVERLPSDSERLLSRRDLALVDEAGATVRRVVARLGEGPEVFGLIHTDLEPDNVILEGGVLRPIDFEHCGWGYYLYDIGASLLTLADQRSFPALRQAFLESYQRIRPLPAEQLQLVDAFLLVRALFSLRLTFLETWDLPGTREDARSLVPFMLGGIRRLLAAADLAAGQVSSAPSTDNPSAGGEQDLQTLSTVQFLARLRSRGIRLRAEDEQLHFAAPKGALTPDLRDELKVRKAEILAFLKQTSAPRDSSLPPVRPAPRDPGRPLPLSFAQNRLWFIDQMNPGSAAYNIPVAVRVEGLIDRGLLERAFNELVRRHEVLRTTFGVDSQGEPCQIIAADLTILLALADLSRLPASVREVECQRVMLAETVRPFDLAAGPLVRFALLRLDEGDHLLLFTKHHIVTDAWSSGILVRELVALYKAFSEGESSPLDELPVQYADFAHWQRENLQGKVLEDQLAYWRQQLQGAPGLLELPTDRPRPSIQSWQGERRSVAWPASLRDRLNELAKAHDVTLFMVLVAAYGALLGRYSGQLSLSVGTPIAGRGRQEIEGLIGFFVNTLVLRNDLSGNPTFAELLARTRQVTLQAYQHQDLPFERLVEELQPQRSLSHTPLFQAALVFQNVPGSSARLPGLALRRLASVQPTTHFDLTLGLEEASEGLRGSLLYRPALFDATTVRRLVRHLENLLELVSQAPDAVLSEIPLLGLAEKHQLLSEWNDPLSETGDLSPAVPATADMPLHRRFEAQAQRSPEAVALVYTPDGRGATSATVLSYGRLDCSADGLAHRLQMLGAGPDVPVALFLDRSPDMVIGILGILKAGAAYVPLDPSYPAERLAFLLEDAWGGSVAHSGAPVIVTRKSLADRLPLPAGARLLCLDETRSETLPSVDRVSTDPVAASPSRPGYSAHMAYILYTSGSTGRPKGVGVSHANVASLLRATEADFSFGRGDVWSLFHSYAFDFSVWEMWGALAYGGRLVVVPLEVARSADACYQLLSRERVTVLNQTPSAFGALSRVDEAATGRRFAPRWVIFGGEALEPETLRSWLSKDRPVATRWVNMYGITETTVHVTHRPLTVADLERARGSVIGRALSHLRLQLLDRRLRPVPIGVAGELHVGGAGLVRGYRDRPALTAERFVPDPFLGIAARPGARLYCSGDLARSRVDSDVEYLGRIDLQVQVRGFRVELGEIEATLSRHPAIDQGVVALREDVPGDQRLVAYAVVRPSRPAPTDGELREYLQERLPGHMVPGIFELLEALPVNANGKVDRRALPAPRGLRPDLEVAYAAPRTALERQIAELWQQVLGVDQIGRQDSFFDLGGHSLLLARVRTHLAQQLEREIPIVDMFRYPTVSSLAEHLAGAAAESNAATELEEAQQDRKRKQGMNRLRQRLERVRR